MMWARDSDRQSRLSTLSVLHPKGHSHATKEGSDTGAKDVSRPFEESFLS